MHVPSGPDADPDAVLFRANDRPVARDTGMYSESLQGIKKRLPQEIAATVKPNLKSYANSTILRG